MSPSLLPETTRLLYQNKLTALIRAENTNGGGSSSSNTTNGHAEDDDDDSIPSGGATNGLDKFSADEEEEEEESTGDEQPDIVVTPPPIVRSRVSNRGAASPKSPTPAVKSPGSPTKRSGTSLRQRLSSRS